jgi:predicted metal-dependent enzyme (double-stranded beta helix superfamily)
MFDLERFIEECRAAAREGQSAVRELVARTVVDPGAVMRALGEPTRAGLHTLYRSDDLTILNLVWGPYMTLMPHDHGMWAVIGLYTGREDNIFWRRIDEPGRPSRVEAAGAKALSAGEAVPLGKDIIHSVTNPIPRLTGALHVYGGDFFRPGRSEWDPETLRQGPYDAERVRAMFEAANEGQRA